MQLGWYLKDVGITSTGSKKMSILNGKRQETIKQAALAHRENMQKSLQHRLAVARAKGDEELVRQLEAEANYLK